MTMNCWPASPPPSEGAQHVGDGDLEVARARGRATASTHEHRQADRAWPRPRAAAPATTPGRAAAGAERVGGRAIRSAPSASGGPGRRRPARRPGPSRCRPAPRRGGRSPGRARRREDQHARRAARRTGPPSGSRRRQSSRAACGTTRPTNAIGPQAAVAAPASSITASDADDLVPGRVHAQRAGDVVAELEQVEPRDVDRGEHQSDEHERQHLPEDVHVPPGRASRRPRSGTRRGCSCRAARSPA